MTITKLSSVIVLLLLAGFLTTNSCKKKETPAQEPTIPLEFTSLTVTPDTIGPGKMADVTASAKGDNISYQWSTSHGDLFGAGSSVKYAAAPCCLGTNSISCIISDGRSSISKEIKIEVKLP